MSDHRLRNLQRLALQDTGDTAAVWSYARELERIHGVVPVPKEDVLVPFRRYVRTGLGVHGQYTIFDNCGSINGVSFLKFPFKRHYENSEEMCQDISDDSNKIELVRNHQEYICGYAIIDRCLVDLLHHTKYNAGNDSGYDTVAAFKVSYCVDNAHTVKHWKYELDDYSNRDNSGWKTGDYSPVKH